MNRRGTHISGTLRRAAITAAAVLALGACSAEDIAERAAEEAIEQQLENEGQTGDVDIDLDDGEIRIEGPDGSAVINVDGDGEGNIQIGGSGSQGDVDIDIGSEDLPDDFPDEVPVPDGLAIDSSAAMQNADGQAFTVNGQVGDDFGDANDAYRAALESAGFSQQSMTESTDGSFFSFVSDDWNVVGGFFPATDGGGGATFGITVVPVTAAS